MKEHSKKEAVEEMFDSIAVKYDFLNHFLSLGIDKVWRRRVAKMVAADSPQSVLDVATGTADLVIAMDKRGVQGIVGVDLSASMIEVGLKKLKDKGLDVGIVQGDAESLPFDDESFDGVTCAFGVRNFGDTVAGLGQMYRVLRSCKKCYILEYSKIEKRGVWRFVFNLYFRHILPFVGGVISGNAGAYTYLPDSVGEFASGEQFLALMRQVGFVHCRARLVMGGVATIYTGVK